MTLFITLEDIRLFRNPQKLLRLFSELVYAIEPELIFSLKMKLVSLHWTQQVSALCIFLMIRILNCKLVRPFWRSWSHLVFVPW